MARIVIADDSATTRHMLKLIVESAGHEVVAAVGDGLEALKAAHDLAPDLLMLDLLMPSLDGVEVLTRLGAERPRVVMLSSVTSVEKIQAARAAGLNYYVLKPFTQEKVLEVVGRCLAGERR